MRGIVKEGYGPEGTVYREDFREPELLPGTVKIKVKYGAICGSDLHMLDGAAPDNRFRLPVVIGHEGSGTIVEVGEGVKHLKVGDRVVAETTVETCMQCEYCYESRFNCCSKRKGLGSAADGYFGEYIVSPERSVHVLPENVSLKAAAIMEPLACAVHGVMNQSDVQAGDVAVVSGPGPIGLLTAQVARANGCVVVLTGRSSSQNRLDFAKEVLGFEHVVNTTEEDAIEYVRELTDGRGCDVFYESAGANESTRLGLELLAKRGQFIPTGIMFQEITLPLGNLLYNKELTFRGVRSTNPEAWVKSLRLLKYGMVDAESLVTHILPLKDWKTGFELMRSKKAIKVLLEP